MVYEFLADGFEIVEAMAPLDMLTRAGCEVTTIGVGTLTPKSGAGVKVTADRTEEGFVLPQDAELVILPGGMPGTTNLLASPVVRAAVRQAADRGLYVAAICAAPWVLEDTGLLAGKKATIYPTMREKLQTARYTGEAVTVDGKMITGRAVGCAVLFGLTLIEKLRGQQAAEQVKQSIHTNW